MMRGEREVVILDVSDVDLPDSTRANVNVRVNLHERVQFLVPSAAIPVFLCFQFQTL